MDGSDMVASENTREGWQARNPGSQLPGEEIDALLALEQWMGMVIPKKTRPTHDPSFVEEAGHVTILSLFDLDRMGKSLPPIPDRIGILVYLKELSLYGVNQADLPASMKNLVNLAKLDLSVNLFKSLPEVVTGLPALKEIDAFCSFSSIPESIGHLTSLERLVIWNNRLTSLPESIGNLVNLRELDVHLNELVALPESIGNLVNLKVLDASMNRLAALPESIGKLRSLVRLECNTNKLASIPAGIKNLKWLSYLCLEANPGLNVGGIYGFYREPIEGPPWEKQFVVNEHLDVVLDKKGRTHLLVDGEPFRQCMRLVMEIHLDDVPAYDEITSIDEAAVKHATIHENKGYERAVQHVSITPEEEFTAHCSNIQAWYEHGYDVRLLHSNLSWALLVELSRAGDVKAKRALVPQVIERITSGNDSSTTALVETFQDTLVECMDGLKEYAESLIVGIAEDAPSSQIDLAVKFISVIYQAMKGEDREERWRDRWRGMDYLIDACIRILRVHPTHRGAFRALIGNYERAQSASGFLTHSSYSSFQDGQYAVAWEILAELMEKGGHVQAASFAREQAAKYPNTRKVQTHERFVLPKTNHVIVPDIPEEIPTLDGLVSSMQRCSEEYTKKNIRDMHKETRKIIHALAWGVHPDNPEQFRLSDKHEGLMIFGGLDRTDDRLYGLMPGGPGPINRPDDTAPHYFKDAKELCSYLPLLVAWLKAEKEANDNVDSNKEHWKFKII